MTNSARGNYVSVSGGLFNVGVDKASSVAGGGWNSALASYSAVNGGYSNNAHGRYAAISGGRDNFAYGKACSVGGGGWNEVDGNYTVISGGLTNRATGTCAAVSSGKNNHAVGYAANIAGGGWNSVDGRYSFIGGGYQNRVLENYVVVYDGVKSIDDDRPLGAAANKKLMSELESNPNIAQTFAMAQNGETMPDIPEMARFWSSVQNMFGIIGTGEATVEPTVKSVADRLRKLDKMKMWRRRHYLAGESG